MLFVHSSIFESELFRARAETRVDRLKLYLQTRFGLTLSYHSKGRQKQKTHTNKHAACS